MKDKVPSSYVGGRAAQINRQAAAVVSTRHLASAGRTVSALHAPERLLAKLISHRLTAGDRGYLRRSIMFVAAILSILNTYKRHM